MPLDASLRVFSGANCIRIPNRSANTKAPIKLAYGSLAKRIPAREQVKVMMAASLNDLVLIISNKRTSKYIKLFYKVPELCFITLLIISQYQYKK